MRAVLEFDLDEHSDDMALKRCHKSLAMALVLFDFCYNTHNMFYEICKTEEETELVDKIFDRFRDLMSENYIEIDELIE